MRHLMAGRVDLLRPLYWAIRSAVRDRAKHPLGFRWPLAKIFAFEGAIRYALFSSWKKAN
jgi:hypothetical protein